MLDPYLMGVTSMGAWDQDLSAGGLGGRGTRKPFRVKEMFCILTVVMATLGVHIFA